MIKSICFLRLFVLILLVYFAFCFFIYFPSFSTFPYVPRDAQISDEALVKSYIQLYFYRITSIPVILVIIEYFIFSFLIKNNKLFTNKILKINNISAIVLLVFTIIFLIGDIILHFIGYVVTFHFDLVLIVNQIVIVIIMLLLSIYIKSIIDKRMGDSNEK